MEYILVHLLEMANYQTEEKNPENQSQGVFFYVCAFQQLYLFSDSDLFMTPFNRKSSFSLSMSQKERLKKKNSSSYFSFDSYFIFYFPTVSYLLVSQLLSILLFSQQLSHLFPLSGHSTPTLSLSTPQSCMFLWRINK